MVKLLTNAEVRSLNLRAGPARVTDLRTNREYDIFWGGPPIGGGHTDFSPLTPQDTEIMQQISGGWNWNARPVILHIESRTGERHALAVGLHHFPHGSIIGGNPGLPNMPNVNPPRGQNWPIGGHFCMFYMDSMGGTPGMREAAHEAFRIALLRGENVEDIEDVENVKDVKDVGNIKDVGNVENRKDMRGDGKMSNSPLVVHTNISPHRNSPRNQPIRKITIHHNAGNITLESLGAHLARPATQASYNYGISTDGRIGMFVEESDRSWGSSSPANDHQAIVIGVANNGGHPDWPISDNAFESLINLCVDICQRNQGIVQSNGLPGLTYDGTANGSLTRHNMFVNTICPGPFLQARFPEIANEVNRRLGVSKLPLTTPGTQPATMPIESPAPTTSPQQTAAPATTVHPTLPQLSTSNTIFSVRVGAFDNRAEADIVRDRLRVSGYPDAWTVPNGNIWQAQVASGPNFDGARRIADALKVQGFEDVVVI